MMTHLLYAIMILSSVSMYLMKVKGSIYDNEIYDDVYFMPLDLPECDPETACARLQANTRGIMKRPYCSCPGKPCPMQWDEDDGFTLAHGSNQFKFCEKLPALELCHESHLAYVGRMEYSHVTGVNKRAERFLCRCPESHYYRSLRNPVFFTSSDLNTETMEWKYNCIPLPECQAGDFCKAVTDIGPIFSVEKRCKCPQGLRCPTQADAKHTFRPLRTPDSGLYDVQCHP